MIFFLEVRLIRARVWELSLSSIVVWANLPNTNNDRSESFENSSFNFFVLFPRLRSICSIYWIDLSVDSLSFFLYNVLLLTRKNICSLAG